MDKKTKQENLDFLVDKLSNLKSVIFTNFQGLNAQEMSSIKQLTREQNGEYKVVKNTIALKAMDKSNKIETQQFIAGPCAIAFLPEDPIPLIKTLVNFSKEHQALILKGGVLEGEIVSDENLKKISTLPSKIELLTNMVGDLNAPVSGLVNYLHQMIFGLVNVINSIKNSSEKHRDVQDGGNKDG